jgi:hypothetical protein
MIIEVESLDRDEGTIVIFRGRDQETGLPVMFGCDHRMAQPIADALSRGESPEAVVEDWQIFG